MALTNRPSGSIFKASGAGISLSGLDLIVDPGIIITSVDGYGVVGEGGNAVTCNGAIGGRYGLALFGSANQLTVGASGLISGTDTGVSMYGGNSSSITNNGVIFGKDTGAYLINNVPLINNGEILAGDTSGVAVRLTGSSVVLNIGTIQAGSKLSYAIYARDDESAPDTIVNAGLIKGKVHLGNGNDTYIGLKGSLSATYDSSIDGGDGTDQITGGVGVEVMTGGTGNDTFFFKTKPSAAAVDHITDFMHGQDHVGLSKSLFKLDPGQSVASAFQDITTGLSKQGEHKHILYNHNTGWLSYDADGKGGAAPIHFATLDTHPVISSGDILMA